MSPVISRADPTLRKTISVTHRLHLGAMQIRKDFFQRLESRFPGGSDSPWFVYAALVFQANDYMDLIGDLWAYVSENTPDVEAKVVKARKTREALLKASALVGFPKVSTSRSSTVTMLMRIQGINACTSFRKSLLTTAPELEDELEKDSSLRLHLKRSEKDARGLAFFSRIYAQHTDRVLQNMSLASGGDLSEFAINAVYGDLMAEETRLNAMETGLLEFLACYATGYV